MTRNLGNKLNGFSLVELLVVIAIIGILTTFIAINFNEVRKEARDERRVADLQQILVALELYKAQYGEYPCEVLVNCSSPVQSAAANGRIGIGGQIDTLLTPFLANIPQDPLGTDATYNYYIDPRQVCTGHPHQIVIFARTMETDKYKNSADTICAGWGGEGGAGQPETHMVVVGESTDS